MLTAQKVYAMLENQSLWQTATQCHKLLTDAKIPHAVMGGVAAAITSVVVVTLCVLHSPNQVIFRMFM